MSVGNTSDYTPVIQIGQQTGEAPTGAFHYYKLDEKWFYVNFQSPPVRLKKSVRVRILIWILWKRFIVVLSGLYICEQAAKVVVGKCVPKLAG